MRQVICYVICLCTSFQLFAQKTIVTPPYDNRNTGIHRIGQIELSNENTRVKIISEFIPNWWVTFNKEEAYLEDSATGNKYQALSISGIEWGEKKPTPACGADTFYITYAPLPPEIQKINWVDGDTKIFGIQLTETPKNEKNKLPQSIIGNWLKTDGSNEWTYGIHEQIAIIGHQFWNYASIRPKGKTIVIDLVNGEQKKQLFITPQTNGNCKIGTDKKGGEYFSRQTTFNPTYKSTVKTPKPFFHPGGTARLQGYLKGYSPQIGFSTGIIYASNDVARHDFPIVITFHPDGRFEADIPTDYPITPYIILGKMETKFYLVPQDTLTLYLDWEDLLLADRYRNKRFTDFKEIRFMGKTSELNNAMLALGNVIVPHDYKNLSKTIKSETPTDFKTKQMKRFEENQKRLTAFAQQQSLSPDNLQFLKNDLLIANTTFLLDYASDKAYLQRSEPDTTNKVLMAPISSEYYDFLQQMPLNDEALLANSNFSSFVNRFEFSDPLRRTNEILYPQPAITFYQYLKQQKVKLTPEEDELLLFFDTPREITPEVEKKFEKAKVIFKKYEKQKQDYIQKYVPNIPKYTRVQYLLKERQLRDSLLTADLKLSPNLVYQITKIRDLKFLYQGSTRAEADTLREAITKNITHPYLKLAEEKMYQKAFPEETKKGYALPTGKASEIFKKIVEPYKGKLVMVDFWATTCAPCRAGISRMKPLREEYKGKDVAFVFITDENSSPKADYEKFMANVEGHKYRIPEDDYNYLRQLFRFNGIPHYILLNKEGNVLDDDFESYNAKEVFERLLKE